MSTEWNAASYQRVSAPMEKMGREVLDRLLLAGDETVCDAGCGTGRVTAALAQRLPRGRVIGVDGSHEMVRVAREHVPDANVEFTQSDLLALDLPEPVDAIFSTATFHWIADHDALFARLHANLAPGGRLVAQCGGAGNAAGVSAAIDAISTRAPFAEHLGEHDGPWRFAGARETEQRLRAAGFTDVWCWLQPVDVEPDDPEEYFTTIMLRDHLDQLPDRLRTDFVRDVLAELGPGPAVIHYVRLNMLARRGAS